MAFTLISANTTVYSGDALVHRITLVAGPTVDATLSIESAPSGGTTRGLLAAKAGDTRVLEFHESNRLHKTLSHCTISGTGAKAVVEYEAR
jgi:hypothetical protein